MLIWDTFSSEDLSRAVIYDRVDVLRELFQEAVRRCWIGNTEENAGKFLALCHHCAITADEPRALLIANVKDRLNTKFVGAASWDWAEERMTRAQINEVSAPHEVTCGLCNNRGLITVWHPSAMAKIRRNEAHGLVHCDVACTCQVGDKFARIRKKGQADKELPRYNESRWIRVDPELSAEQNLQRLKDWAANYKQPPPKRMSNYTDFGEYSGERRKAEVEGRLF